MCNYYLIKFYLISFLLLLNFISMACLPKSIYLLNITNISSALFQLQTHSKFQIQCSKNTNVFLSSNKKIKLSPLPYLSRVLNLIEHYCVKTKSSTKHNLCINNLNTIYSKAEINFLLNTVLDKKTKACVFADENADDIVRKADEKMRGKTSQAEITIQTVRPTWKRELKLRTWAKGQKMAMILITSPAKESGTVFLKKNKEVWNWLPSIERVIKLPPSMMAQSWMGTDFSNDDLVKESSVIDDYTKSISGEAVIQGRSCYIINMIPKPEAAIVWGMIKVWIDKADYIQMRAEYYDEEKELVNVLQSYDVKMLGNRLLPARLEMTPADKPGNKTIMMYTRLVFDEPIADDFFTTQQMKIIK